MPDASAEPAADEQIEVDEPVDPATPVPPPKLKFFGRPSFGGAVVGAVFFWQSLYPTLLPRSWVVQAAVTALCTAIGYALGTLAGHIGHRILQRGGWEPSAKRRRTAWIALGVAAAIILLLTVTIWPTVWNDQRDLVAMGHVSWVLTLPMLLVAAVLLLLLVLLGRLVARGVIRLHRFNSSHLPRPIAIPVSVVLVAVIGIVLFRQVVSDGFQSLANSTFSAVDDGTNEGTVRPTATTVSGAPGSKVAWKDLGVQGREFVAHATPASTMDEFSGDGDGPPPMDPIRVYVGLNSADYSEQRAALAVEELDRTGAFDRQVLVVATSTGTGWIDPDASEALELMYRGDSAIVSMQYSFLPSWISTLVDRDKAQEAGRNLYDAVYARWKELPTDDRPKLIAFGLSLGSFGGEAAFEGTDAAASVQNMVDWSDGALWVGATNGNHIWGQVTDARDEGSPVWQPAYDDGESVRFSTRGPDPNDLPESWDGPRILYLQHPTDPVTFWTPTSFWSEPPWMDAPRGYDVPQEGGWYPIVTALQGVFDLMAGFSAPPGFGHDFRLDYVGGWSQVAPPDGWTDADTEQLEQFLWPS